MVGVVDDGSHASKIPEIPWVIEFFVRRWQSNGLLQDGTESWIAGCNGVLKIADDETIGCKESLDDGFHGSMPFNILF